MKRKVLFFLPILAALAGCSFMKNGDMPPIGGGPIDNAGEHTVDPGIDINENSGNEIDINIGEGGEVSDSEINKITDLSVEGISYDSTNKIFNITKGGEFAFTGEFNGNIVVDAGDDDEIKITLNGFTIKSSSDSPIKCNNASELQVSIKKGSKNYIYDERSVKEEDDETQGNGAITSSCDMKLSGKGSLIINAKYNNGIHCKDDLKISPEVYESSSIQIEAYNNAIKGNDSVTISSGNFVLISTNGNGIITENSDLSSKGKQRGTISITGGQVDIYSAKDAIDAAYNAEISASDVENPPIINIYTSKYSSYSNEVVDTSTSKMYLRFNDNVNTSSYYYAVEFLTSDYYTSWVKANAVTSSGGRYKYLSLDVPNKATSMKVFSFTTGTTSMSEDNAYGKMSSYQTINTYYDTAKVSVSGTSIYIDGWTNYSSSQQGGGPGGGPGGGGPGGGMSEGNTEKAEVSAKGIKADNLINISEGEIFIKSYDDALHANYGTALENDATGVGDVIISGGNLDIYASDDGIHADHKLQISGGNIDIKYSYEGIEGNIIDISGGYTKVYSVDDGLNAANKSGVTPSIDISGGVVDITVYGQDVDGIDSNGSFAQSGGYVITKGGNSQMSTGLDVDGSASIKGGTFVSFGRTEKTPSKGSGVSSYSLSGNYQIGNYRVVFGDGKTVDVSTKYSYSVINVYSDNSTQITVTKI